MEKFTSKNFKILMIAVVVLLGVLVYGLNAVSYTHLTLPTTPYV